MKKLIAALALATVVASPAFAASKSSGNQRGLVMQNERAAVQQTQNRRVFEQAPYAYETQDYPNYGDLNIRDRLQRDYPDFH